MVVLFNIVIILYPHQPNILSKDILKLIAHDIEFKYHIENQIWCWKLEVLSGNIKVKSK